MRWLLRPRCGPSLKRAIERSYNRISVDGDTSTNDTVAVLANGASGVQPPAKAFEKALTEVLESLARQIVRDGEGARKLITIDVEGATSERAAEKIARAIANSPLVKTAIAGSDPNWGRILSAAGNAGVAFDPRRVDIDFQGVAVCRGGLAAEFSEDELKTKLDEPECSIRFAIRGGGRGSRAILDLRFHGRLYSDQRELPDLALFRRRARVRASRRTWSASCNRRRRRWPMGTMAGIRGEPDMGPFSTTSIHAMPGFARFAMRSRNWWRAPRLARRSRSRTDDGDENKRVLQLDWLLEIQDQRPRRKIVKCTIERVKGKWKITALDPIDFFKY